VSVLIFFGLAALLGLTWLAYKQHAIYARLTPALVGIFVLIYFGTIVWDASAIHTFRKLVPYFPTDKRVEASKVGQNLLIWPSWVSVAVIGSNAYVAFLLWGLPWLLRYRRPPGR
jgi:hypothetical protein